MGRCPWLMRWAGGCHDLQRRLCGEPGSGSIGTLLSPHSSSDCWEPENSFLRNDVGCSLLLCPFGPVTFIIISQFLCSMRPTKFSLLLPALHGLCLLSSYHFMDSSSLGRIFSSHLTDFRSLHTSHPRTESVSLGPPVTLQERAPPWLGSSCWVHLRGRWSSCIF